jgi:muramidase (phage lysozyme)
MHGLARCCRMHLHQLKLSSSSSERVPKVGFSRISCPFLGSLSRTKPLGTLAHPIRTGTASSGRPWSYHELYIHLYIHGCRNSISPRPQRLRSIRHQGCSTATGSYKPSTGLYTLTMYSIIQSNILSEPYQVDQGSLSCLMRCTEWRGGGG